MLFKADIDAAYRRIPLLPCMHRVAGVQSALTFPLCLLGHRVYGHIAFMKDDQVFTAEHLGMPFGAVASVHAWHRIGE